MVDLLNCSSLALLLLTSNFFELLWVFILVLGPSTVLVNWGQMIIKAYLINLCLSSTQGTIFLVMLVLFKVILSNDCPLKFLQISITAILATLFILSIQRLHILVVGILCVL